MTNDASLFENFWTHSEKDKQKMYLAHTFQWKKYGTHFVEQIL